jgi:hypothetical protein
MGSEVDQRFFEAEHFSQFRERLDEETALLKTLFANDGFSHRGDVAGFELEAWIVDQQGLAAADNVEFLERMNSPLVVPELALFNIELNGSPSTLSGRVFTRLHDELAATWQRCLSVAHELDRELVTIGTLPSATPELFVEANMSTMLRYKSLNDRVMALRDGRQLLVEIEGDPPLALTHHDVMLEAAATSFQIHLQCKGHMAVRDFNASLLSAAPLVAVGANSPFLFGHELWDESRIPLFEQSVDVGERNDPRVTFGRGYVQASLFEIFEENQRQLILIPMVQNTPANQFSHVRFQNGTLWRWVRPLIGFDFDGQVHLRIEQRVPSAGPTIKDCIANAAFYFGIVRGLGLSSDPPEQAIPFRAARDNFYNGARYGLGARVNWQQGRSIEEVSVRQLIDETLLPLAQRGLQSVDIPDQEISEYLDIIGARNDNSQNGAAWQRRWRRINGATLQELVQQYLKLQNTNQPVHTWSL